MKNDFIYFVVLIKILLNSIIFSQPLEYRSQFIKSYLVNYYAIKNDYFLTKLAYKRFSFLDEASDMERRIIKYFDKDYLVLYYKDIVALHTNYQEFNELNQQELAFLHASEPACLTATFNQKWKFYWMHDRRFPIGTAKYRLYWGMDSTDVSYAIDSLINPTEISIDLPKSARWIKLKTIVSDDNEIDYSFPIYLQYDPTVPVYVPETLTRTNQTSNSFTLTYKFRLVSQVRPDSVWIFVDENNDNQLSSVEKYVYKTNFDTLIYGKNFNDASIKTGLETYLICFKGGKQIRYPRLGHWTSNVNNRCMNKTYSFYVMNVQNPLWWDKYIEVAQKSLENNYGGLFADDTWTRVGSWGVDTYPPYDYNDTLWYYGVLGFLKEIKAAIKDKPLIFNGLSSPESLKLLQIADGGMDEGFAYNSWSGFLSLDSWKASCNRGLKCINEYRKMWVPLSVLHNYNPYPRLYSLASFLLVADSNSYFACAPNYQVYAHFPEFDIPTGKPMQKAINSIDELQEVDAYGKKYYKREFEKCIVYVNPNSKDTVKLDEINGKYQIVVDSALTIDGGALSVVGINSNMLLPQTAKIILKGPEKPILASPIWRNAKAKLLKKNEDELTFEFYVEAADSSSDFFKSNPNLPLYCFVDLTKFGIHNDLVLKNDGTKANPVFSAFEGKIDVNAGGSYQNLKIPFVVFSPTGLFSVGFTPLVVENIDTSNLVPNYSFEYDIDLNSVPDGWNILKSKNSGIFEYDTIQSNAKHLNRSSKFNNLTEKDTSDCYMKINIPKNVVKPIKVSGWSKSIDVSGTPSNNYSIYVDFFYTDGTPWYGKTTRFSTSTHDWEYSESTYMPEKPLDYALVHCLFRAKKGIVWFDKIFVGFTDSSPIVEHNFSLDDFQIQMPSFISDNSRNEVLIDANRPETATISIIDILGRICYQKQERLNPGKNAIGLEESLHLFPRGVYGVELNIGSRYRRNFVVFFK